MLAFVVVNLAAYAAAMTRILVQAETDSANRQIFPFLAMIGITMLAADGLSSRQQVEQLLKRLVVLATVVGASGLWSTSSGSTTGRSLGCRDSP